MFERILRPNNNFVQQFIVGRSSRLRSGYCLIEILLSVGPLHNRCEHIPEELVAKIFTPGTGKQETNEMKKLHQILAALILCFATAFSLSAQRRVQTMNLDMAIDDMTSGVRSDGSGPYQNGTASVLAAFGSNGYFAFNSGTRQVNFIYSTPSDGQEPPLLLMYDLDKTGVTARTFPINTTTFVPIQSMQANTSQCLGMTWEYSPGTNLTRNVSYHYGTGDQSQTAYVTVSYNGTAWTIEPVNQANCGNGEVLFNNQAKVRTTTKVKNKVTNVAENGRYLMPFRLSLTAQP